MSTQINLAMPVEFASAAAGQEEKKVSSTYFCQWSVLPNDIFIPSGPKQQTLKAGVYKVIHTEMGPAFVTMRVITDELIQLEDEASDRVLKSMKKFWESKKEYDKRGIVYKRGILLYGQAGSGKTSLVNLLVEILVGMDGIVLICADPGSMAEGLSALRLIEPTRNVIVVFEDIDEMINNYGEHKLLSLLDGEDQIDNVVNVATTNFPETLGARICNRPSRFDERIHIGMPNEAARRKYLTHILREENISPDRLIDWVADTDGFSVAHLKELAIAVFCLQQPYDDVLMRLKEMQEKPKGIPEFSKNMDLGFLSKSKPGKSRQYALGGTGASR